MQIKPTQYWLLVEIKEAQQSASIILPDTIQQLKPYGLVKDIGPECKTTAIGDKVLFNPSSALIIEDEANCKLAMITEGAVFAKYIEETTVAVGLS